MLAVQTVYMNWQKNSRSPQYAAERRQYYRPYRIDPEVVLNGNGVFVCNKLFFQRDRIYLPEDRPLVNLYNGLASGRERDLFYAAQRIKRNKGLFYNIEELNIRCIDIAAEGSSYRIKWHDSGYSGMKPVRTGYNEDFNRKGSAFCGKGLKCETAFCLKPGEAGRIRYNYRYLAWDDYHYEQTILYFLNIGRLRHNSFVKAEYKYNYDQLERLYY